MICLESFDAMWRLKLGLWCAGHFVINLDNKVLLKKCA
jgi:hypothetical protein|uniref:Uncharacterized protein n=1 Tax=Methylophaga nitratireducenticrescens TaxID=754476 RepID=I1XJS7_METNJ